MKIFTLYNKNILHRYPKEKIKIYHRKKKEDVDMVDNYDDVNDVSANKILLYSMSYIIS